MNAAVLPPRVHWRCEGASIQAHTVQGGLFQCLVLAKQGIFKGVECELTCIEQLQRSANDGALEFAKLRYLHRVQSSIRKRQVHCSSDEEPLFFVEHF